MYIIILLCSVFGALIFWIFAFINIIFYKTKINEGNDVALVCA